METKMRALAELLRRRYGGMVEVSLKICRSGTEWNKIQVVVTADEVTAQYDNLDEAIELYRTEVQGLVDDLTDLLGKLP